MRVPTDTAGMAVLPASAGHGGSMLRSLYASREADQHSDCTLICPEGQLKANKFVLASNSIYFRDLFKRDITQKEVRLQCSLNNLRAILNLIYRREVPTLPNLDPHFITLATHLGIAGLLPATLGGQPTYQTGLGMLAYPPSATAGMWGALPTNPLFREYSAGVQPPQQQQQTGTWPSAWLWQQASRFSAPLQSGLTPGSGISSALQAAASAPNGWNREDAMRRTEAFPSEMKSSPFQTGSLWSPHLPDASKDLFPSTLPPAVVDVKPDSSPPFQTGSLWTPHLPDPSKDVFPSALPPALSAVKPGSSGSSSRVTSPLYADLQPLSSEAPGAYASVTPTLELENEMDGSWDVPVESQASQMSFESGDEISQYQQQQQHNSWPTTDTCDGSSPAGSEPFILPSCSDDSQTTFTVQQDNSQADYPSLAWPQCQMCNALFPSEDGLLSHIPVCRGSAPTPPVLGPDGGQEEEEGDDGFNCTSCMLSLQTGFDLLWHMRLVHNVEAAVCSTCNRNFKNIHSLQSHISRCHGENQPTRCPLCSGSFTRRDNCVQHLLSVHHVYSREQAAVVLNMAASVDSSPNVAPAGLETSTSGGSPPIGELSNGGTPSQDSFEREQSLDTLTPLHFLATLAGADHSSRSEHVSSILYDFCQQALLPSNVENQVLSGTYDNANVPCTNGNGTDGEAYRMACPVNSEPSRKPAGEKKPAKKIRRKVSDVTGSFKCRVCKKIFKTEIRAKVHESNEHGIEIEGLGQCNLCHKTFKNSNSLSTHMSHYHTGRFAGLMFVCTLCTRRFTRKDNCKAHIIKCHTPVEADPELLIDFLPWNGTQGSKMTPSRMGTRAPPPLVLGNCSLVNSQLATRTQTPPLLARSNNKSKINPSLLKLQCALCEKKFKNKITILVHLNKMHLSAGKQEAVSSSVDTITQNPNPDEASSSASSSSFPILVGMLKTAKSGHNVM